MRWSVPALALSLIPTVPAWAQNPPPADVSELVVTPSAKCLPARANAASRSPRIVGTFPANGAVVRPGRLVVRVTFDRPMTCSGFFLASPPLPSPCGDSHQAMVLSFNRRTVRLACSTAPNTIYGVRIGEAGLKPFISLSGQAAEPYNLTFSTTSGPEVKTLDEALAQDR